MRGGGSTLDHLVRRLPEHLFWAGKRVLVTGHTGFKGGWLAMWLRRLGANVCGYSLPPPTTPSFFEVCGVAEILRHVQADVRNAARLAEAVAAFGPEIVFHLAAQPLVRAGYAMPLETFETNVMGTVNLLAAVRAVPGVAAVLVVTSDKVYAETDGATAYDEAARLGGRDPYSASKACAELAAGGFPLPAGCRVATLRSGNVIGGGDWAADRLVADFLRAMLQGERLQLRQPHAIRPWQHVLEPVCGYLVAAEQVCSAPPALTTWNFGPAAESEVTVQDIAQKLCTLWGADAGYDIIVQDNAPHEAAVLRLNSQKAMRELGWRPRWTLDEALARTVDWFRAYQRGAAMADFSLRQIEDYA